MGPPRAVVHFYSVNDAFGDFSNFAAYPISVDGLRWSTSEHYFQAQKMVDPRDREAIRRATSPAEAARKGRDRSKTIRRDWESAKVAVMRRALEAKVRQHAQVRDLLLSTGDAKLVEHTENDDYWGDGGDGRGKNMLGRLLMELRDTLRRETLAGRTSH